MASAEIALVCGLKVRVGCQDRLYVNSNLYKLDVLRGRLLGSQNNFHWQLGG